MIDGYQLVPLEPEQRAALSRAVSRKDYAQEILDEREAALGLVALALSNSTNWKIAEDSNGGYHLLRPVEAPSK